MKYMQSVDEIVDVMTAPQKILWQQVRLIVRENAAVQQMNFSGIANTSPFATYSADTLYLALQLDVGFSGSVPTTVFYLNVYDELNALTFTAQNSSGYYDSLAPAQNKMGELLQMYNFYFGRLAFGTYSYVKFIGFKFMYVL